MRVETLLICTNSLIATPLKPATHREQATHPELLQKGETPHKLMHFCIILAAEAYEAAEAAAAGGVGLVLPACEAAILRLQLLCSSRRQAGKLLGNGFSLPATPHLGLPPEMD